MLKTAEIKRNWIVVDAADRVLGQVATEIATKLIGKTKRLILHTLITVTS